MNLTTKAPIGFIPAAETHMMEVVAGVDVDFAISEADCLDGAVLMLLNKSISDGGMDVDIAFLCRFAMEAAKALRTASGITA